MKYVMFEECIKLAWNNDTVPVTAEDSNLYNNAILLPSYEEKRSLLFCL